MQFYLPSKVYREHRACLILADDSCFPVLLRCDRVCLVSPRFSGFLFSLAFSFAGFRWRVLSNVLFTVQSVDRDWNHFQHSESIDFDANSLRRSLEYFMDLWRLLCIYIYILYFQLLEAQLRILNNISNYTVILSLMKMNFLL